MKKGISFFIIILTYGSILLSNPVPLPQAIISELKFEENNVWLLEISLSYTTQNHKFEYDSICVETSSGSSRIRLDYISGNTNLLVVTSDSLTSPLSINREGDYVKVYSFLRFHSYLQSHFLFFGNYHGSIIDSLPMEYSIVRISEDLFVKDQSPSIGQPNDTVGTCGVLTGHIYDKNNRLLTEGTFQLDNIFSVLNDGSYLTNVYSRNATFSQIFFHASSLPAYLDIDTIELNINPGVQYEKDIHILDDFSGVEEYAYKPDYEIRVINYPNPFNASTNFAITIPSSQKYKQKQINIYNVLGQRINSITLTNQSSVQWDGKDFDGNASATGTYYYQLVLDNKIYKSGSMILLK